MRGRSLFQKMAAAPHIVWAVMFIGNNMRYVSLSNRQEQQLFE